MVANYQCTLLRNMVAKISVIIEKNESIYGHKLLLYNNKIYGNKNNSNNRKNESIYGHKLLVCENVNYGNKNNSNNRKNESIYRHKILLKIMKLFCEHKCYYIFIFKIL